MRCIGQGLESLKTFCAVMSLPNPVEQKSHDVINNKLSRVMKEVAEESMKMAAVEEYSSSPDNLLTVSGDGTWKTRGHSSLIGICTVIGTETGKVLDREVLSSFCKGCDSYKGVKFGIKYNKNGKERIRFHVEKIILALLCKGNAESHLGCVWGHSCSTDDEPMHWFCPTNPNTWCKYNAAINNNLQNYKHKPSVAKAVRDVLKPVFADLSHPALLKKCLEIAEIAANLETSVFNDGNQILITILEKFGLKINRNVCVPWLNVTIVESLRQDRGFKNQLLKLAEPRKLKRVKKLSCFKNMKSDTMAYAVLADPTRALQGTNRGRGPAMEVSENDVGSLEQLLLYADERYLAGKLPLGDHLGKFLHGVEEYHQHNVGPLRSARIVERVTVGSTSVCSTIFRTYLLVVFLAAPNPVFHAYVPTRVHCSQEFLTAHSKRSTWPATGHADQPAVFIRMIRPL
ncbi:uncharacterized protein TNCV_1421801 [Trichonephila clavipes]|nr:uncharacterized protein TNCV_1421801 [Trichonephila clavipes]